MEYDREGYRYDGSAGLFQAGANPAPKTADYSLFGVQAGADASAYAGAGFFEATATTGIFSPGQLINQGTARYALDPSTGTYKKVGKKYSVQTAGGVAEVDCLMCHLDRQYANLERNFAFPGATAPKLGASLGLVGAGISQPGLLSIATKGTVNINPNPSPLTWSWNERIGFPGSAGNPVTLGAQNIVEQAMSENCALCHFPDKSMAPSADSDGDGKVTCADDPSKCGPASKPLGFTAFQKYMAPGSAADDDERPNVNGKDGNNDAAWAVAKGRVEGGKRGESMNDPLNPDAHMSAGIGRMSPFRCSYCHNNLSGSFAALTDSSGNVIQEAAYVQKMDHQFAKGDNTPDGKNMDQLDNTVTCAGCHVEKTHPNSYLAPYPNHAGFPALHFEKISCRTCHIPVLNGPVDQDLADFTVGPFQTFERTQTTQTPAGVNRRPVYLWRSTEHGKGPMEIQPFGIMAVALWANASSQSGEEVGAISPTFQRLGKKAAEQLRAQYGDALGDGVYDWTLNRPQGGDTTLIVNRPQEIADFIAQIGTIPGAPANPVMHFYFNQFSISHNVRPIASPANPVLGSLSGGGCVMCHSSSDPASPSYSDRSVGFFDKQYELFKQPVDGGAGLVQTSLPANTPLSGNLERINIRFPYKKPDGSSAAVDLTNSAGTAVGNRISQGQVLGYDAVRLAALMDPKTASYEITAVAGAGGTISPSGTTQVPALTDQTFTIAPNAGYYIVNVIVDGNRMGPISSYTFSRVSADHTIAAEFASSYTITAYASAYGSISPSGLISVNSGDSITFTFTPNPGYRITALSVDGKLVTPVNPYTFTDVSANHKIKVYFGL